MESWLKSLHVHRTTKGLPLKPRSINKRIEAVRTFLKYLAMHGLVPRTLVDQIDYVNEPKLLPTSVLHHAQVKKLIAVIRTDTPDGYRDRTLFEVLYSTGVRAAEILGLDVPHVDLRNATALVTGKGNKQRVVPIGRTALRHLETYIRAVRPFLVRDPNEAALFLNHRGMRLPYQTFLRLVHIHAKRAGLDVHVTPHTFRRSCATEMLRGGANMYHVKELLGHETLNTLKHYAKLTITDLKKTHEKCHPRERDEG
jgi:integrase/recombinase XerD